MLSLISGTNITSKMWMDLLCFLISSEYMTATAGDWFVPICPPKYFSFLFVRQPLYKQQISHEHSQWMLFCSLKSQDLKVFLTCRSKWMLKETFSCSFSFSEVCWYSTRKKNLLSGSVSEIKHWLNCTQKSVKKTYSYRQKPHKWHKLIT